MTFGPHDDNFGASGVVARAGRKVSPRPLNFGLQCWKIFLSGNFHPKMQNLGLKTPFSENLS